MSRLTLIPTHLRDGTWQGVLRQDGPGNPRLSVTHMGKEIEGVELLPTEGSEEEWTLRIPVPASAIADGVQTILISDATDDTRLGHFTLIAGEAGGEDMRGEMDLLRAELDMLKRAFRRHCVETA